MRTISDSAEEAFREDYEVVTVEPCTQEQYVKDLLMELCIYASDMARWAKADRVLHPADCNVWQSEALHFPTTFHGSLAHYLETIIRRDVMFGKIEASAATELYVSGDVRDRCDNAIKDAIRSVYGNIEE
jgi:hypothetical protein